MESDFRFKFYTTLCIKLLPKNGNGNLKNLALLTINFYITFRENIN